MNVVDSFKHSDKDVKQLKVYMIRNNLRIDFQIDPFKTKSGGMINMNNLKSRKPEVEDAYDVGIGTQFSAETNKRDEDEEMMKYVCIFLYTKSFGCEITWILIALSRFESLIVAPDTSKSNWTSEKIRN